MSLETATYINGLVVTNPVGASDPKSKGDDHIRLIKSVIKNTFPNITGQVTATHGELNRLTGGTGTPTVFPAGTQMVFYQATAPTGWTQITVGPARLLRAVSALNPGGGLSGSDQCHIMSAVPSHTHSFTADAAGSHTHRMYASVDASSDDVAGAAYANIKSGAGTMGDGMGYITVFPASGAQILESAPSHTHAGTVDANSDAANWQPYIMDVIVARKD